MIKVRRERPSQRLHHRVNAPIIIDMPGGTFEAEDWSLGGFRVQMGGTELHLSEVISVGIRIPFQGFEIGFEIDAEVRRVFEDVGTVACSFIDVQDREREIMELFVEELVRGSVTVVGDIMVRIDTPVTPVSTKADPNPAEEVPLYRWPIKQIVLTTLYMIAGILVVGYAYTVFTANFLRMEVSSAMVTAPIEAILATADGKIEQVIVKTGEELLINTALFVIESAKVEERIEMAKIKVNRETMELVARQKTLASERSKSIDYRTMMLTKLEQASAKVRALERQLTLAQTRVSRLHKLQQDGLTTRTKVETARSEYAVIKGRFEEALAEKRESQMFLESVKEGRVVDGNKINTRLLDLQAEVDLAWDRIMLAKDELMALQRHKERLTLAAPSN
ncbi:MAG: PilZ domain-containing protein, partial [Magnetovibrio sp.]|nr:PilZ domain-containing protein [Magnetovibrio sp.]